MSFNEISEFRTAISQLTKTHPGLVKGGHRSVMWVILSYPDGCFIGQQELADQAGYSVDTVKTYLRDLTSYGFIQREQKYARKGIRQCYRVVVSAISDFNRVAPNTPIDEKVSSTLMGGTESVKSGTGAPNECDPLPTYRYTDSDKNERVKTDRFLSLKSFLPAHLKGITQGPNVDAYLDVLDVNQVALEVTARHLSEHNYSGADKPHAIAVNLLRDFSRSALSTTSTNADQELPWCGECKSSDDRRVANRYLIKGRNGATTDNCPKCSRFAQLNPDTPPFF